MADTAPLIVRKSCPDCGTEITRRLGEKPSRFAVRSFCDRACFTRWSSHDLARRFWASVTIRSEDDCWPWNGDANQLGHGRISHRDKKIMASHVSLELSGLPMPFTGAHALHSCDNPPCCNPKHLRWGTQKQNSADMVGRNRCNAPRGERSGHARLTRETVIELRASDRSLTDWHNQTGVSLSALSQARAGKTWRHL